MKKLFLLIPTLLILCAWSPPKTLKGTWQFAGGIYNGKKDTAATAYKLQRSYDASHFNAYLLEEGQHPQKYQGGNYILQGDSCLETETFSAQPSKLTGKTVRYHIRINRDTLIFNGRLPSGMRVEEYWKKVK